MNGKNSNGHRGSCHRHPPSSSSSSSSLPSSPSSVLKSAPPRRHNHGNNSYEPRFILTTWETRLDHAANIENHHSHSDASVKSKLRRTRAGASEDMEESVFSIKSCSCAARRETCTRRRHFSSQGHHAAQLSGNNVTVLPRHRWLISFEARGTSILVGCVLARTIVSLSMNFN